MPFLHIDLDNFEILKVYILYINVIKNSFAVLFLSIWALSKLTEEHIETNKS